MGHGRKCWRVGGQACSAGPGKAGRLGLGLLNPLPAQHGGEDYSHGLPGRGRAEHTASCALGKLAVCEGQVALGGRSPRDPRGLAPRAAPARAVILDSLGTGQVVAVLL